MAPEDPTPRLAQIPLHGVGRGGRPTSHRAAVFSAIVVLALIAVGVAVMVRTSASHRAGPGQNPADVLGVHWQLVSVGGVTAPGNEGSFYVDGMRIHYDDTCEVTDGTARLDGDTIRIGLTADGLVGCTGTRFDPDKIDKVLSGTVHWSVTGDTLTLTKGKSVLIYRRVG